MVQNKGGRPRHGEAVKRAPMNMKTSPELRSRIEQAAELSGLSMSQEVERRLIDSFSLEDQLGGPRRVGLFRLMAWAISVIEGQHGGKLEEDFWAFHRARGAIDGALNTIRPPLPSEIARELERVETERASAYQAWAETAAPLMERYPHLVPKNALAPVAAWVTVPNPRFGKLMTDDELEEVVADLPTEEQVLVRAHQESVRRLQAWETANATLREQIKHRAEVAASEARTKTETYDQYHRDHRDEVASLMKDR